MQIRIKLDNDYAALYNDASVGLYGQLEFVSESMARKLPWQCDINQYEVQDVIEEIKEEIDDYESLEIIVDFDISL